MEIRKQLVKRNIAGDVILVPIGDTSLELQGLVILNETGELCGTICPRRRMRRTWRRLCGPSMTWMRPRPCGTPRRFWSSYGSWTSFLSKTAGGTHCVPPAQPVEKVRQKLGFFAFL